MWEQSINVPCICADCEVLLRRNDQNVSRLVGPSGVLADYTTDMHVQHTLCTYEASVRWQSLTTVHADVL
jgi:hypothetical protein